VRLLSINLSDFRSWREFDASFDSGQTLLLGRNGVGKTNVIEAIGFVSTLGSHRTTDTKTLIHRGADQATVTIVVEKAGRPVTLEACIAAARPVTTSMNGNKMTRPRDILGYLPTVLFCPEDLDIIRRDPAIRRTFIDELLIARYPRFSAAMAEFGRIVKQRGTLLKSASGGRSTHSRGSIEATLDAWDEQFVNASARMLLGRLDTLRVLRPRLTERHNQVSDSGKQADVAYSAYNHNVADLLSTADSADGIPSITHDDAVQAYSSDLRERRDDELRRGVCLVGPQRDDVSVVLGEELAKGFASHGETWSVALGLKLACFDVMRETHREDPVLLLDDVFAELDEIRRQRLADAISGVEQVIITAAVAADVPKELGGRVIEIDRESDGVHHG
jgi:DNA replication and repair protein RecF